MNSSFGCFMVYGTATVVLLAVGSVVGDLLPLTRPWRKADNGPLPAKPVARGALRSLARPPPPTRPTPNPTGQRRRKPRRGGRPNCGLPLMGSSSPAGSGTIRGRHVTR
jgi:hypothetical protein